MAQFSSSVRISFIVKAVSPVVLYNGFIEPSPFYLYPSWFLKGI